LLIFGSKVSSFHVSGYRAAAAMEGLQEARSRVQAALHETITELRRAQRNEKSPKKYKDAFHRGIPNKIHREYILTFLIVAGGDAGMALSMLQREHRLKFPWEDWCDDRKTRYVEDLGSSLTWQELMPAVDDVIPHVGDEGGPKYRRACCLHAEATTASWVRQLNITRALTPTSMQVLQTFEARVFWISTSS